jgi:hypothetical protein
VLLVQVVLLMLLLLPIIASVLRVDLFAHLRLLRLLCATSHVSVFLPRGADHLVELSFHLVESFAVLVRFAFVHSAVRIHYVASDLGLLFGGGTLRHSVVNGFLETGFHYVVLVELLRGREVSFKSRRLLSEWRAFCQFLDLVSERHPLKNASGTTEATTENSAGDGLVACSLRSWQCAIRAKLSAGAKYGGICRAGRGSGCRIGDYRVE